MKCIEAKIVVLGAQGELGERNLWEYANFLCFCWGFTFVSSFLIVPHCVISVLMTTFNQFSRCAKNISRLNQLMISRSRRRSFSSQLLPLLSQRGLQMLSLITPVRYWIHWAAMKTFPVSRVVVVNLERKSACGIFLLKMLKSFFSRKMFTSIFAFTIHRLW